MLSDPFLPRRRSLSTPHGILNELGQLVVAIKSTPAFLCSIDELEYHREGRFVREAALRADRAVPHGGKGALDWVRGPQVFPVFGGEIVECEQGLAILRQALGGLTIFQLVGCDEGVERGLGILRVSAIQISCNDRLAFGCWLFGSLLRMLAVLCTQQRCWRVLGHSSRSAFQKPSAPSAAASSGVTAKPRFCQSRSSSRQT